jgi:hypothetical protein
MMEEDGRGWLTSTAPLTYWAWPPTREGCWSDMVVVLVWLGCVGVMFEALFSLELSGVCIKFGKSDLLN